ncbi:MAG TPA: peptide deformylase [Pirellulales bacterium]|jgi:peptide deformylase|nr:peptide deformylase [Pirellulales bacterium]
MAGLAESLKIIQYPHPTLRHVAKPIRRIDAEMLQVVRRMFDLMYEHKGIGLAATQVALPYRLFVLNLKGDPNEGEEHVFVNPVITKRKGLAEAEEGCLSLPGLYGDVKRSENITLQAFNLQGQAVKHVCEDLFARAVQHEIDHLDGVLFIDRLTPTGELKVKDTLDEFTVNFAGRRRLGEVPSDEVLAARLKELEQART